MDDKNGASSTPEELNTASDQALADLDYSRYAEIENARDRGKPIPEASAPSTEPSDQTPAPEPGTAKPIQEKKPNKGEERKAELATDIEGLLKRRAELRAELDGKPADKPGDKKADPPPAQQVTPKPAAAKAEAPKKPDLANFATFAEYDAAHDAYVSELVTFKANEVAETREAARDSAAANKVLADRWAAQKAAAAEEHADFAEVAFSKDTPITPVMDGFILDSENGARILYKLGENGGAEGKRIAALSPYAAVRALVAIENSLSTKKEVTPVKKHTAAPPPATHLGGTDTEPADAALAALAAGDMGAYISRMNARDHKKAA